MDAHKLTETALRQLDRLGYYLSRYGISDDINRHNLIAIAMTEKEYYMGELSRLELRAKIARHQLEARAQQIISKLPGNIDQRFLALRSRLLG